MSPVYSVTHVPGQDHPNPLPCGEREFGGEFQALQHRAAALYVELELARAAPGAAARLLSRRATWARPTAQRGFDVPGSTTKNGSTPSAAKMNHAVAPMCGQFE